MGVSAGVRRRVGGRYRGGLCSIQHPASQVHQSVQSFGTPGTHVIGLGIYLIFTGVSPSLLCSLICLWIEGNRDGHFLDHVSTSGIGNRLFLSVPVSLIFWLCWNLFFFFWVPPCCSTEIRVEVLIESAMHLKCGIKRLYSCFVFLFRMITLIWKNSPSLATHLSFPRIRDWMVNDVHRVGLHVIHDHWFRVSLLRVPNEENCLQGNAWETS